MPEILPDDPVTRRPMAGLVLISVFILMLTVGWSLYQEFFGLRPWRTYQTRFANAYSAYLDKLYNQRKSDEQKFYSTPQYLKLVADIKAATDAAKTRDQQINQQVALLDIQRAAMTPAFQVSRGKTSALAYELNEIDESDKSARDSKLKELKAAQDEQYEVDWPVEGGKIETAKKFSATELANLFTSIMAAKATLVGQRATVDQPAKDVQQKLNDYVKENLPGMSAAAIRTLDDSVKDLDIRLRQVNVNPPGASINNLGGVGLVDRCQSCHVGTDPLVVPPTITLTKADLGFAKSNDAPFSSHPDLELMALHPMEKFGCSPCHGGNGRAADTVEKGHGRYEHWLWPMYYPENVEAGCQQCHAGDARTEHAPVLNQAKILYREKGCIGCHRFQGFDNQDDQLVATRQQITQLENQKEDARLEIAQLNKKGDTAADNATANQFYAEATDLTVQSSRKDGQIEQLDQRSHNLLQEIKKVGPDLKEVRMKIHKEWIPYWLKNTHTFRPTTKMPQFRLQDDEIQAIAAYVWQSALTGPELPKQMPGNAAHGKELFEERGCMACHSMGEGPNLVGGDFAANLSRVGEKDNYDYLVRWILNPRTRTRPYSPTEHKDLGPEDYAKHNVPYVFDLDHSKSPDHGHELLVEQMTVMPNLRLTVDEARDIASYLETQKHADATYAAADFMDDPKLKDKGKALIQHYGCAGCHEISGLEDEGRIGVEMTNEGSKPIERLDFALYTEDAKTGVGVDGKPSAPWYTLKDFFGHKLTDPAVFDKGKYLPDPMDRLRMPKPNVDKKDIDALTTFLLGSVDPSLPPEYMYKPTDQRADVQKGWWVATKYNCIGCHQIAIGQSSVMMGLPQYQSENKANLPPVLTSEGARVNPEWLKGFLANPSLSTTDMNKNGVRSYLQVRMPTLYLSDDEIRSLVLFFGAMSSQAQPFIPQRLEPITTAEKEMARDLFTSNAAPCLKCHAIGDAAHDKNATAPNFLFVKDRLRPAWAERWITNPALIIPGTAMPSGLFKRDGDRWVFAGPVPATFNGYHGDHADLLVRYMFNLTPEEQRSLVGRTSSGGAAGAGK